MRKTSYLKLSKKDQQLIEKAEETLNHGINKITRITVGAALRSANGKIYQGACIGRSRTSKQSRCAEEMALDKAMYDNAKKIEAIAIIAKNMPTGGNKIISPCGSCRQLLHETNKDMKIILASSRKKEIIVTNIKAILPLAY